MAQLHLIWMVKETMGDVQMINLSLNKQTWTSFDLYVLLLSVIYWFHKTWKFKYFRKQQDLIKKKGETLVVYIQSAALLCEEKVVAQIFPIT